MEQATYRTKAGVSERLATKQLPQTIKAAKLGVDELRQQAAASATTLEHIIRKSAELAGDIDALRTSLADEAADYRAAAGILRGARIEAAGPVAAKAVKMARLAGIIDGTPLGPDARKALANAADRLDAGADHIEAELTARDGAYIAEELSRKTAAALRTALANHTIFGAVTFADLAKAMPTASIPAIPLRVGNPDPSAWDARKRFCPNRLTAAIKAEAARREHSEAVAAKPKPVRARTVTKAEKQKAKLRNIREG